MFYLDISFHQNETSTPKVLNKLSMELRRLYLLHLSFPILYETYQFQILQVLLLNEQIQFVRSWDKIWVDLISHEMQI